MKKTSLWCLIVFLNFAAPAYPASVLDDWRFPDKSDVIGDWQTYRQEGREYFTFTADFNGDGNQDEAWILIRKDNSEWGLFVFLSERDDERQIIELERFEITARTTPQGMGIGLADPGYYLSACAKGYGTGCEPGERMSVELKNPAIDFFMFESANSFFFWNEALIGFERIWISD
jgi:hypothetical protein